MPMARRRSCGGWSTEGNCESIGVPSVPTSGGRGRRAALGLATAARSLPGRREHRPQVSQDTGPAGRRRTRTAGMRPEHRKALKKRLVPTG